MQELDESNGKDWKGIESMANNMRKEYNCFVVMVCDPKGKAISLEITVQPDKIDNEKVPLKYSYGSQGRVVGWNRSCDLVPFGLRPHSVPSQVWADVFRAAQDTVKCRINIKPSASTCCSPV